MNIYAFDAKEHYLDLQQKPPSQDGSAPGRASDMEEEEEETELVETKGGASLPDRAIATPVRERSKVDRAKAAIEEKIRAKKAEIAARKTPAKSEDSKAESKEVPPPVLLKGKREARAAELKARIALLQKAIEFLGSLMCLNGSGLLTVHSCHLISLDCRGWARQPLPLQVRNALRFFGAQINLHFGRPRKKITEKIKKMAVPKTNGSQMHHMTQKTRRKRFAGSLSRAQRAKRREQCKMIRRSL